MQRVVRYDATTRPIGALMVAFGSITWLIGAKYTLDGWIMLINTVLLAMQQTWFVSPAVGPAAWLAVPLGVLYSLCEFALRPVERRRDGTIVWTGGTVLTFWLLANASDVGTTYLGLLPLAASPIPALAWVGSVWPATALAALALTYYPELAIVAGVRLLGVDDWWRTWRTQ